ncbi:cytochrome c biogenesis protein ResB [Neisseria meningitidis]|uniref:cytochrome c biogenesis protein ResB n=1 Tax=Neisseria meningitidis TaxID=487 RepID=UPI00027CC687|nr:cytochrome c biogenesis protein ResB [Neisseria meningitidis]ANX21552.1 cytochrome C biogenesis protein [Neisseria meningitidis]ANX24700.1 cytochrome C biogenesis protein [Neisseria meningitidis]ANX37861.1 cytochrome C biogenesis protein [Neisseria meningitidis]ANX51015.1 cytochrome C biogenesis protein [Neisseria meningitidis]ANX72718.1 cytochrome C biogenesis protein [Neisseria meningitidis]
MRFAVALLSLLGIASVIGTVLQQNQPQTDYLVKFGSFWAQIFGFLGLYDVYASAWFVVIMMFLVVSTSLCLIRNVPPFWREMKSFREKVKEKSLAAMRHSSLLDVNIAPEVAKRYLEVQGFQGKTINREDGSVLIAAKKGTMNKWGYIFAHVALIVICLGGLIDSNLLLKLGMLTGRIVPDNQAVYAKDFKPESILGASNLSFRGNVNISEGQSADVVFLNADNGILVQDLPFEVKLKKFHIDFYNTGMPRDFASDIEVTDKATGEKLERTIRVNHPLTLHGITIYQASFADGGSDLTFKAWNLGDASREPVVLKATSIHQFPLEIGKHKYRLEFDQFTSMNVEDMSEGAEREKSLKSTLNDVRAVTQEGKKYTNIGPSIVYRIRDAAGQAVEYKNYMLPVLQEQDYFWITGTRSGLQQQYRWLRIPLDKQLKADTFMALREFLKDGEGRKRLVADATKGAPAEIREQFMLAAENTLNIFAQKGYLGLDEFITSNIPKEQQDKMQGYFYEMLYGVMNAALDETIRRYGLPEWQQDEARNRFLLHSMDAYTGLTEYPAPMLLQLDGFSEVRSSGLQMTRSPGALLVYLGSVLLVLGTVLMFYVREKRAWVLFSDGKIRFAMSSARSERDLQKEFPKHVESLQRLGKDLNHD